jgi:hypothetical protein
VGARPRHERIGLERSSFGIVGAATFLPLPPSGRCEGGRVRYWRNRFDGARRARFS